MPVSQNGSGVANSLTERFDELGNLVQVTDERGVVTVYQNETATSALRRTIQDAGGLNLVTDYENDAQGRVKEVLGPEHEIDLNGVATMVRQASWTVYKDAELEVCNASGFQDSVGNNTLINPVRISRTNGDGQLTELIAAVRVSTAGKLLPTDTFPRSSYVRWKTTQYTDCCLVTSERLYHDIPSSGEGTEGTNYAETNYGYDVMKRLNRTVSSVGTITFNVLDVRDNIVSTYIGTNDTGATSADPTGGGAPGNNMVLVTQSEYDDGLAGEDNNLTQSAQYADATTTRVTTYNYDWRNRGVRMDLPQDRYFTITYDNLDRMTQQDQYAAATDNLIGRQEMSYDDLSRQYQSKQYGVDPATGAIGNALISEIWYDRAGNVLVSKPAGSQLFFKSVYDSIGRLTTQYAGFGDTTYADPVNVSADTILEQYETTYDDGSNALSTLSRQRYHDTSGTGPLGSPSSTTEPKARVTYSAYWHDGIGRSIAVAEYGTNGGAALVRPDLTPARSDSVLVTTLEYDDSGLVEITVDPAGTETRFEYDDGGRQTKLIENYRDGAPETASSTSSAAPSSGSCPDSSDVNRTTQTIYTVDSQISQLIAWNASTGDQTTQYEYGTTLSDSEIATGELLRRVRYPDSTGESDSVSYSYNRLGQRAGATDQRGCVHEFDYDQLGRLTEDRVTTLPADVDGSVQRLSYGYEVRGLVELLTSHDDATVGAGNVVNQVEVAYNEFGQISVDRQSHSGAVMTSTTPQVQYSYENGSSNTIRPTTLTYPNGRVLTYGYGTGGSIDDNLSRVASITDDDSTQLVAYEYLGQDSFVDTKYPQPDIRNTLISIPPTNDPNTGDIYSGLDRFSRITDCRWHSDTSNSDVDRFQYGYDRASNRLWRENVVAASMGKDFDELYEYDGLYRLKDMQRGRLNSSQDGITSQTFAECWALDETGNWEDFRQADTGSTWTLEQTRTASEVNEITGITNTDGSAWSVPAYDPAGNMTSIPQPDDPALNYTATYDAWNRLVRLEEDASSSTSSGTAGSSTTSGMAPSASSGTSSLQLVQENQYDARSFRIIRNDYTAGAPSETRHFYYTSDWQNIEERVDTSTAPNRHHIWGQRYIDDLILRDRSTTGTLDERLYATQDVTFNVVAITDNTGSVKQRFAYQPYGQCEELNPDFTAYSGTGYRWQYRFTGREFDLDTGLMYFRARYYDPNTGEFISRDPLGYVDGMSLYRSYFVPGAMDPSGLGFWSGVGNFVAGAAVGVGTAVVAVGAVAAIAVVSPVAGTVAAVGVGVVGAYSLVHGGLAVADGVERDLLFRDTGGRYTPDQRSFIGGQLTGAIVGGRALRVPATRVGRNVGGKARAAASKLQNRFFNRTDPESVAQMNAARDTLMNTPNEHGVRPSRQKVYCGSKNTETGKVQGVRSGSNGCRCAENAGTKAVGGNSSNTIHSEAIQNGQIKPVCIQCQQEVGGRVFPPGAQFSSDVHPGVAPAPPVVPPVFPVKDAE